MYLLRVPLIFLLFIVGIFCEDCPRTFNHTQVTLVGARDVTTVEGCFQPVDEFVRVSYIQIINEYVPVLRRAAIKSLPNLADVIIDNCSVTELEPGSFADLPKLYLIKLRHNDLRTIREGVFSDLPLVELCLTNNSIESIHPNAFNNLPNLTILQLDQNRMRSWSAEWFIGIPKLSTLNFEFNSLESLPRGALRYVKGVHYDSSANLNVSTHIHLNNNKIRYLSDGTFDGIQYFGWLFLHRNELEEISERSLGSLRNVDWIRLDDNRLRCIPRQLVDISSKVLWYIGNNPLTEECREWCESIKNNMAITES